MNVTEMTRDERKALFHGMVKGLQDERAALLKRVQAIDTELADYGFATSPQTPSQGRQKKPQGKQPRSGSLKAIVVDILGNKPMKTPEVAAAVLATGLKSNTKTFQQSVTTALGQLAKAGAIRKVGRGLWRAR